MTGMICPTCGVKGHPIKQLTVDSLAQDTVLQRLKSREGFFYCPTPTCPVAWFQPETGGMVDKSELKVRIGMKETSDPRPICYCFDHDAVDFEKEIQEKGQSEIPATIAAKCKQGLDRCGETNPQGSCCLGNVNRVVKAARQEVEPTPATANPFAIVDDQGCCATEERDDAHK